MIDLKQLRENPQLFKDGCAKKRARVDIDRLLALDEQRRSLVTQVEASRAEQNKIAKDSGPQIGKLAGQLKKASGAEAAALQQEIDKLKERPAALKVTIAQTEALIAQLEPEFESLVLQVPLPPDDNVPVGKGSEDNQQVKTWHPSWFDPAKSFEQNKGFAPRNHIDLVRHLKLADFERGVKMAGTRSYVLTGDGMRLHQAVLRYAFDYMVDKQGFTPVSVPVLVREECMIGTGFFPDGREQAYHIPESQRQAADVAPGETSKGYDLFLTGTGEVGLMGLHQGEILDETKLPLKYVTVSTCFRREAGAAGKDTAGLYRIHQFDKVEQVIICRNDAALSRELHKQMISYVEAILQSLEIPYRLLQCCTGDLGFKNADMVDIESWMPGRGEIVNGSTTGAYGETHSASRLHDFQCRRLNMRYRRGTEGETTFCHSLNNTVLASPRFLIPVLELYQNEDSSVTIPTALRPYMGNKDRISAP